MQANFIEKVKGFLYSVLCPSSPSGLMWTSMLALGLFIWGMGGHRLRGAWVPNLPLKKDILKVGSQVLFCLCAFLPLTSCLRKVLREEEGCKGWVRQAPMPTELLVDFESQMLVCWPDLDLAISAIWLWLEIWIQNSQWLLTLLVPTLFFSVIPCNLTQMGNSLELILVLLTQSPILTPVRSATLMDLERSVLLPWRNLDLRWFPE